MSCLAFASSTAHEHRAGITEHLSVEYLFYHSVERMPGKNPSAGTTMHAAAGALWDEGQPVETAWPYNLLPVVPWNQPALKTPLYKRRMSVGALTFDEIVKVLDGGQTVVCGLIMTQAFYQPDTIGRIPDQSPDPERGGHAVLAVGHGVQRDGIECLLIRNSWGTAWGVGGYGWLSRAYIARQLRETATLA